VWGTFLADIGVNDEEVTTSLNPKSRSKKRRGGITRSDGGERRISSRAGSVNGGKFRECTQDETGML